MNYKKTSIIYYLSIITLSIIFVIISMSVFGQTYVPITNHHNGISIGIQGTEGADYVFDRYYFDPLINDCGLCYIKSDVDIELSHNDYNSRIHKQYTIIRGGDFGIIRYKVDKDWQNYENYAKADNLYPAYQGPLSFDDMEYEAGVHVVGTIGINPGYDLTDKSNIYSRGMLDEAGNEYHYFTYYDDDSDGWAINDNGDDVVGTPVDTEESASDGKSMLFCVNPKTPAIWLSAAVSGAEYYTTPAKVWYVPKIHEQTSYVTDNVDIQLKNIMNSNAVYYQIDGSGYQQYTAPISSNTLSDGEHTLEFYYDASYVQSRKIVKNPDHPSKQDVFEDGSGHGYLLWRDEAEFLRFKERMLNGVWSNGNYYPLYYEEFKNRNLTDFSYTGNNGVRNQFASQELMFAMVGVLEGVAQNPEYMEASKIRLMNNPRMHIETIGWETQHSSQSSPSHELTYRGYTDDKLLYANAFTYDLLVKYYRSDQQAGGITPIEDFRLRDMMASTIHETMMFHGSYEKWMNESDATGVNPGSYDYMWITARAEAAAITSLTMPAYNTNYYGTAGYDGTQATYNWTPYPDQAESWKDVFITYTDNSNPTHVARLNPFPNRNRLFNWFDGSVDVGLIRDGGDFAHKLGYCSPTNLGHGFEIFYNVMKRKFDMDYPKLYEYMDNSIHNTIWSYYDKAYGGYGRGMMANEYFPALSPDALVNNMDIDAPGDMKYLYVVQPYYFFFHNPEWESAPTCQSTDPPTVPSNLAGNVNETSINLTWDVSTHSECAVAGYKITRDDADIAVVQGNNYTDTGLSQGEQYQYAVAAVSEAGVLSDYCTPIQLTTIADVIPPTIVLVPNTDIPTTMFIEYSESLDQSSAETTSNYTIDNGITVSSAQLQPDTKTVRLTVSSLTVGTQYTITINNVSDSDGNVIAANSTAVFSCVAASDNLALNKPVLADSELSSDYTAENAVDGNTTDNASRWVSASSLYPHWIEIDLLQPTTVDKVDFYTGHSSADYLVYDYQIQYWDGAAWIDAVSVTGNTLSDVSHSFTAVSTEKLRLYCTDGQDNIVRLFEIEAYNNSGSAVIVDVDGVSVSPASLNLNIDGTSDLTETVSPANATNKTVTWESGDPSIATVDAAGVVTGVAEGECDIIVTTVDGGFTANCTVTVTQSVLTAYYCDPVNGNMSNDGSQAAPWSTLEEVFTAGKTFAAGDVINLLSGYHGSVSITGNNAEHVIIQAAAGNQPTMRNVSLSDASFWTLSGLTISPELATTYERTTVLHLGNSNNIIVDNCELYSVDDISSWTADDWVALSCYGIYMEGDNNIVRNSTIRNIDFGVANENGSDNNLFENNQFQNFSGDGMRVLGDYNTVQNNTFQDNYNVDSNHDDGIQSYSIDENWVVGAGTVYGNIIRGNTFIQTTDPNRSFQGSLQGLGLFDGMFEEWVVENNIIICDVYHGIAFYGAINCKVVNNTVIDLTEGTPEPWIKITAHKDGTLSSGNTVSNNLVSVLANDANIGVENNNIEVAYTDFGAYFTDYANFDLHLISSSPAIDAGIATDAPATDIEGTARPQGTSFDVGAYEFSGIPVAVDVTGITVSPDNLSLIVGQTSSLTGTIEPSNATNRGVNWSSNDTAVATVDASGLVTAILEGSCTITVTTDDGGYTATCSVTVSSDPVVTNLALGKSVTASSESQSDNPAANITDGNTADDSRWSTSGLPQWAVVDLGAVYDLTRIELYPYQSRDYQYIIEVSDDDVSYITVVDRSANTESGLVLADDVSVSARYVKITVSDGYTYTGTWCSLNELMVFGQGTTSPVPVDGISLAQTSINLKEGETTDLIETVTPSNAMDKTVTWESSAPSIATVDQNGVVSAQSVGQATITVTTNDGGFSADCSVTIEQNSNSTPVTGVTVSPQSATIDIGEQVQLTSIVEPFSVESQFVNNLINGMDQHVCVYGTSLSSSTRGNAWMGAVASYFNSNSTYTGQVSYSINGKSGEDSDYGVANIETRIIANSPDAVLIEWAVNDAHVDSDISVEQARSNLIYMIDRIETALPTCEIILQVMNIPIDYRASVRPNLLQYYQMYRDVANERELILVDHYPNWLAILQSDPDLYSQMVPDGIHPTDDAGVQVISPEIIETLETGGESVATDQSVSWSSSNDSIATVDANGLVTAISAGSATITATTTDGGYTADCSVSVTSPVFPVTGVTISQTSLDLSTNGSQVSAVPVFYWDMETENATIYKPGTDSVPFYSISNTQIARTNSVSYEGDWSLNTQGAWSSVTFDNNSNEDAWAPVTEGTVEFYWRYRAPWGDLMLFQMTGKSSTKDPLYDTNDGVGIRTRAGDPGEFYSAPGARNLYDPIDLVDGKWFRFRLRYKSDRGISLQIDDGPQYYSVETSFGPTECLAWHQILIGNDRASDIGQNIDNFAVYDHWLEDDEQTSIPETYQLTATVLPAEATDQTVVWSTSNPDIATVDTTGFVTPVATGTAIITVTTNDGGYTANCIVNVNGGSSVIDVTGVSVSPVDLGLLEGQSSDLTESVVPADATDKSVLWSSSNNSIAIVDTNGVVSAIAEGEAIITVTTNDGGFTATTNVTVGPASSSPANIALNKPVTADSQYSTDYPPEYGVDGNHTDNASRWISASSAYPHWIEIDLQGTYDVSETRFWTGRYSVPYPVNDYQIQYWNGGNWVDAVSVTGNVSGAVTNTFATVTTDKIRLYCTAGSDNIVRLFEIEVWGVPASATTTPVSGVSIDPTSLSLTEDETMALTTTISPSDATDQTVTWSTSDTSIAIVDDTGIVTALSAGQATITITTNDGGYTASCALAVNIPVIGVTGVSVAPTVLSLDEGQTSSLTASVTPSNATDLSVSWLSSDASVASVDSSGVVSAIGAGQATIIATTIDGGYTASCALTVNEVITSFDFTETFGTGTAATIAEYAGWDNVSPILYSGASSSPGFSKIENTPSSELYNGASGGSNVQIKAGYSSSGWFQVEGINTNGLTDVTLSFGYAYESWSSLTSFTVQVSSDGTNWTQLTGGTSTGTTGDWSLMTYDNIPATSNLMIKFDMAERKYIYIDDIVISTSSAKGLQLDAKSLFTEKSVKLYPNPVSENYFVLDLEGFDGSAELNLRIFDVTGKMVYLDVIRTKLTEIACNLKKGIYFISIDNKTNSIRKKLIVR